MNGAQYNWENMRDTTSAENYFLEASVAIDKGQISKARDLLVHAITVDPSYGRSYNHLGWFYHEHLDNPVKAEELYKKGIELEPDYPPTYINYGKVLAQQVREEELRELMEKALYIPGISKALVYELMGGSDERQLKFQSAKSAYWMAIRCSTNDRIFDRMCNALYRISEKEKYFSDYSEDKKETSKKMSVKKKVKK